MDGDLWRTIDGYAPSGGTQTYTVSLNGYGSHSLDIRNRPEHNLQSSGYTLRFQSLALVGQTYDWQTLKYSYDALSRLVGADVYAGMNTAAAPAQHFAYSYDLAGNRTQKTDPNGTVNYAYDATNRLSYDDTYTYLYDNNGNLTTKKAGSTVIDSYGWDRANRLNSFNNGTAYQYAYDGEGRRVQQTVGSTVTQYLLDVAQGLWEVVAATTGTNTTHHVHDNRSLLSQQNPDSSQHWPVEDALGNVRALVDNTLAPQESKVYWPYGEAQWTSGDNTHPQSVFGFTGEPTDASGLLHLRARYYVPVFGTFLSPDPLEETSEDSISLNRYQYAGLNPVNNVDPSGALFWAYPPGPGGSSRLYTPTEYPNNSRNYAHSWIEFWLERENGFWETHLEFPSISHKIDALVFEVLATQREIGAISPVYFSSPIRGNVFEIEPLAYPVLVAHGIDEINDRLNSLKTGKPFKYPISGSLPQVDHWVPARTMNIGPINYAGKAYDWSQVDWHLGDRLSPAYVFNSGRGPVRIDPNSLGSTGSLPMQGPLKDAFWAWLPTDGLIVYETEERLQQEGVALIAVAVGGYMLKRYRNIRRSYPNLPIPRSVPELEPAPSAFSPDGALLAVGGAALLGAVVIATAGPDIIVAALLGLIAAASQLQPAN